jgi:hypothetical protein
MLLVSSLSPLPASGRWPAAWASACSGPTRFGDRAKIFPAHDLDSGSDISMFTTLMLHSTCDASVSES